MKKFLLTMTFLVASIHQPLAVSADFKPSGNTVTLMPIVMDNLDLLELTTEQLNQIRDIAQQNFKRVEQINAEYHLLKSELREILLDKDSSEMQQSQKLVEELAELDRQRMMLTVECAQGLKRILSAEKFSEITSLYEFQR